MYAIIAMGGVFAGATQAPLTAIASVLEMTGNFTLTLPVMLACGIAAATSKQLTCGSIYTTKLFAPRHRHRAAEGHKRARDRHRR